MSKAQRAGRTTAKDACPMPCRETNVQPGLSRSWKAARSFRWMPMRCKTNFIFPRVPARGRRAPALGAVSTPPVLVG